MTRLTTTNVPVVTAKRNACDNVTKLSWLAAVGLAISLPVAAQAASGYLSVNLNLRAGPSIDYPAVHVAPRGSSVTVYGCLDDYGWCDVSWGGYRGWVSGSYLDYNYQSRRVPVIDYGPRLGLGIIRFNVGGYWDNHYRRQSWYGQRSRYDHVVIRRAPARGGHIVGPPPRVTVVHRDNRYDRRDERRDNRRDRRDDRRDDHRDRRDRHN